MLWCNSAGNGVEEPTTGLEAPIRFPLPSTFSQRPVAFARYASTLPDLDRTMSAGLPVGVVGAAPVIPQREDIEMQRHEITNSPSSGTSASGSTLEGDREAREADAEHVDVSKAEADFAVSVLSSIAM